MRKTKLGGSLKGAGVGAAILSVLGGAGAFAGIPLSAILPLSGPGFFVCLAPFLAAMRIASALKEFKACAP